MILANATGRYGQSWPGPRTYRGLRIVAGMPLADPIVVGGVGGVRFIWERQAAPRRTTSLLLLRARTAGRRSRRRLGSCPRARSPRAIAWPRRSCAGGARL